jgi:predicted amidophosphoribosyltransferase
MAPDAKTCTACNFENPPDATFCGECGAPLRSELRCDGCGRTSPAGTKFCHGCGCGKRQYQRERPVTGTVANGSRGANVRG